MFNDQISDYFVGVAAKYLSAVDADPGRSNQHEIGGLPSVGFKKYLGTPSKHEEYRFKAKQIYITDDCVAPELVSAEVTWYDCRRKQPHRTPEYRLYYSKSSVSELINEGDFLLVAKMQDDSLLMIFSPAGSTTENQLRVLFGLGQVKEYFSEGSVTALELHLPLRLMLEEFGIETKILEKEEGYWLDKLIPLFGGDVFPSTSLFSDFACKTILNEVDPVGDPDLALVNWMEHEEKLFRIYERHIVKKRLVVGFGDDGADVDGFIRFSLSVQNRRKSRVGHAFERYLQKIFMHHGLIFEQGGGKDCVTENNSRPDFMFPGFRSYHDIDFPKENLNMLGAKTTCKDRWRQVLSEANRIETKHLITLEAAISHKQTSEMRSQGLQLIVPTSIQSTYSFEQSSWLINLKMFIDMMKANQTVFT
ncbi:type II restriction endonuclease [Pseudomonas alliivorans]|nr:type II restriction endonuclease [Pseudomonas alliivorans]MEE4971308.1 type II restriction endonuclease [Pseudomonas alliivorans]MEE4976897.1 type II restriction endonuclease [Pseudomonas alliivorans]MEE4981639.1 type II restriction endonuclease [Pseudomonas alliivorans]MEE5004182.1 type II restriction endonuclease [Pseudomonas alliivorans]